MEMTQNYYTNSRSFHAPDCFDIDEEDEAALSIIRLSITGLLTNQSIDSTITNQDTENDFFELNKTDFFDQSPNIFHHGENPINKSKITSQSEPQRPRSYDSLQKAQDLGSNSPFSSNDMINLPNIQMNFSTSAIPNFGPRCTRCGNPCGDDVIYQGNLAFHSEHFTCKECKKKLKVGISLNNDVYCPTCAAKVPPQRNACCICNAPRTSSSVIAAGRCFCKEHFVCAFCGKVLDISSYKLSPIDGNFYCDSHYPKEDSLPMCAGCGRPICINSSSTSKSSNCPSSKVICASLGGTKVKFHSECFNCYICNKSLVDLPKYTVYNGRPICVNCFKQLPRDVKTAIASGGS